MSRTRLLLPSLMLALVSLLPGTALAPDAGQARETHSVANTCGEYAPCPT